MEISKHVWTTPTRPCNFSLSLQGDSVFADFDVDSDGRVCLVRISFDGYGCCETQGNIARMSLAESKTLLKFVDTGDVYHDEIEKILYRYFDQNQDVIWQDALRRHGLV